MLLASAASHTMRLVSCWKRRVIKRLLRRLPIAAVLVLGSPMRGASALEGYPETWCREGMFGGPHMREPDLRSGLVVGKGRAHLLSDEAGCPLHLSRGEDCRQRYSIRSGSFVAVLPSAIPGLACVLNLDNPGQFAGWLPQARVQVCPLDRAPPLAAWGGQWHNGDNKVTLTPGRDGRLSARGHAYWPGRRVYPGHTGALSDTARPAGNRVTFSDKDPTLCVAKLELPGSDLLAANDNGRCGGANVSFGGVYKRAR